MGPKSLCAKNGPENFRFFPTTVTLVWGGGGVQGGGTPLLLRCTAILTLPLVNPQQPLNNLWQPSSTLNNRSTSSATLNNRQRPSTILKPPW